MRQDATHTMQLFTLLFLHLIPHPTISFLLKPTTHTTTTTALFGIKGFRSWFTSSFPRSITPLPPRSNENFHHVLIDVNQLLHVSLRRSRSDSHGLSLFMRELDDCVRLAKPTKSLVLAMDGPASAAKLATQRRRRYGLVIKSRRKGTIEKSLCLTPGTAFMELARDAALYWAWQRLVTRVMEKDVKVYISGSDAAGEGEVKLLDWLLQSDLLMEGETVAIMGGDSDLVLEGLILPPERSHNVFVILPSGKRQNHVVSLWQATRDLEELLHPHLSNSNIMRLRTDLVLLLIMNGNDYLPKIRGGGGFDRLFDTYLTLLTYCLKNSSKNPNVEPPFICSDDLSSINLPFAIRFFSELAASGPRLNTSPDSFEDYEKSVTPLSRLNTMVDGGYMPRPIRWDISTDGTHVMLSLGDETDDNGDENDEEDEDNGEDFWVFETTVSKGTPLKEIKQLLAERAITTVCGPDYLNSSSRNDNDVDDDDDDIDDEENEILNNPSYSWEPSRPVPADVAAYLSGLLWNLHTYQQGVCVDYSYNYGRRLSPTAWQLVDFLKGLDGASLLSSEDVDQQRPRSVTQPLTAGLSCLCALPLPVAHYVPYPYSILAENKAVETIYGNCMSKDENVFDLERFRQECLSLLEEQSHLLKKGNSLKVNSRVNSKNSRKNTVPTGDSFWTVLSYSTKTTKHRLIPPLPISDRFNKLRPSRYVKAATVGLKTTFSETKSYEFSNNGILSSSKPLSQIPYATVYDEARNRYWSKRLKRHPDDNNTMAAMKRRNKRRLKTLITSHSTNKPSYSAKSNNLSPLSILQCLIDVKIIEGPIDWRFQTKRDRDIVEETVSLILGGKEYTSIRDVNNVSRQRLKHELASQYLDYLSKGEDWRCVTINELKTKLSNANGLQQHREARTTMTTTTARINVNGDNSRDNADDSHSKHLASLTTLPLTPLYLLQYLIDTKILQGPLLWAVETTQHNDGINKITNDEGQGQQQKQQLLCEEVTLTITLFNSRKISYQGRRYMGASTSSSPSTRRELKHYVASLALDDLVGDAWREMTSAKDVKKMMNDMKEKRGEM